MYDGFALCIERGVNQGKDTVFLIQEGEQTIHKRIVLLLCDGLNSCSVIRMDDTCQTFSVFGFYGEILQHVEGEVRHFLFCNRFRIFFEHDGCNRTVPFPMFHSHTQLLSQFLAVCHGNKAAVAERAGPRFTETIANPDNFSLQKQLSCLTDGIIFRFPFSIPTLLR